MNQDIVNLQINILLDFTKSLAYYRTIKQDRQRIQRNNDFWVYSMNTYYYKAITDWCIVFGADNNESHWKKISDYDMSTIELEIRSAAGLTGDDWGKYWKEIVDFRNNYAAHRSVNPNDDKVPSLDKAFEIAKSYFELLRKWLSIPNHDLNSLDVLFPNFEIEILPVLQRDF
ncbi:hypothetical protein JJL52_08040 [Methylomicrobium sp. RS1]|nr:hypothetical protein [Methylomicrobium sp. RS1]